MLNLTIALLVKPFRITEIQIYVPILEVMQPKQRQRRQLTEQQPQILSALKEAGFKKITG